MVSKADEHDEGEQAADQQMADPEGHP